MEKKNNNGKTFGDIFSNIDTEKKQINFNDVNNKADNKKDTLKMEDLFNKSQVEAKNKSFNDVFSDTNSKSIFDNASENIKKEKKSTDIFKNNGSVSETSNANDSIPTFDFFNDIDDNSEIPDTSDKINFVNTIQNKDLNNKNSSSQVSNSNREKWNPFAESELEKNNISNSNNEKETSNSLSNLDLFTDIDKNNDTKPLKKQNPFFNTSVEKEQDKALEQSSQDDNSKDDLFQKAVKDSSINDEKKSTEEFNPFFSANDEKEQDKALEPASQDDNSKDDLFQKAVKDSFINDEKKSTEESNPFFSANDEKEQDKALEPASQDDNSKDDLFQKAVKDSSTKDETKLTEESNPFFNTNDEKEQDKALEQSSQDDNSKDDLFQKAVKDSSTKDETKSTEESNPFFNANDEKETITTSDKLEVDLINKSNDIVSEPNSSDEDNNINNISTNPFFEDEKEDKGINNPFFESDKLNLVENSQYANKNIDNKIDVSNVQNFDVKIEKKKEPLIKFILGVLSYAIFIWLLLIGITLLIYVLDIKVRSAKGDNSPPKYNAFVVLTGSMLPDIQVYDVVVTKKVAAKTLEEGDVITFASSDSRFLNTIITHRIIKKNYDKETNAYTFQTKGDNNNVADSALVNSNNIYGKVIIKIPKLGYLQEFLTTDGGWIMVILLPCLVVISYDIVKLAKSLKKKKYKNIKVQSR